MKGKSSFCSHLPQDCLSLVSPHSVQEIHRFGQTRPRGQQRLGGKLFGGVNTLGMVWVVPVDESDKRTRISKNHDRSRRSRSPSEKRCPQFSDNASVVPSIIPIWLERKSKRLGPLYPGACSFPGVKRSRRQSKARISGVVPFLRASLRSCPSTSSGKVIVIIRLALSLFLRSSKGYSDRRTGFRQLPYRHAGYLAEGGRRTWQH